jgi:hypothetical protein
MPETDDTDDDAQDRAEVLDETHLTEDGEDIANFDTLPDVFDATQDDADADEEDAIDADDYGPGELDEVEPEDDDLDESKAPYEADEGLAAGDEDEERPAGFDENHSGADDVEGLDEVRDAEDVEGDDDDASDPRPTGLEDKDAAGEAYAEEVGTAKRS